MKKLLLVALLGLLMTSINAQTYKVDSLIFIDEKGNKEWERALGIITFDNNGKFESKVSGFDNISGIIDYESIEQNVDTTKNTNIEYVISMYNAMFMDGSELTITLYQYEDVFNPMLLFYVDDDEAIVYSVKEID